MSRTKLKLYKALTSQQTANKINGYDSQSLQLKKCLTNCNMRFEQKYANEKIHTKWDSLFQVQKKLIGDINKHTITVKTSENLDAFRFSLFSLINKHPTHDKQTPPSQLFDITFII